MGDRLDQFLTRDAVLQRTLEMKGHLVDAALPVAMEEIKSSDWAKQVFEPDIKAKWGKLYKKPGYRM
jgi:hypothetical protein